MSFKCIDAIKVSLQIEKEGLSFYQAAAKTARDPRVIEIFSRLANEEKEHIQSLREKSQFLQPALSSKSAVREEVADFIAEELNGKVFPDEKGAEGAAKAQNDLEALDVGIESEKRSIEVLTRLMQQEKKIDVRAIFSHLLAEEQKHLKSLEEIKRSMISEG